MLLAPAIQSQLLYDSGRGRRSLPSRPLKNAFRQFFLDPKKNEAEAKKILLCMAKRTETADEVWALIELIQSMEKPKPSGLPRVLDLCGTGGDGHHTFNISTLSAFVIAGAGGVVAKHGNRAVSSKCGSSDLMEALGVSLNLSRPKSLKLLKNCGLAYLHAPNYHPLFAAAQPLRKSLGVRTLFNILGPFLNPFLPSIQMIGVSQKSQLDFFVAILKLKKISRGAVYHSADGLDEISTAAKTEVFELTGRKVKRWFIHPQDYGFQKAVVQDYQGGDIRRNQKIALDLLQGRLRGPKKDIVLLNAGMGLYLSGISATIADGIQKARISLEQKKAYKVFETLKRGSTDDGFRSNSPS